MSDEPIDLRHTAYHEAGHAVVAVLLGRALSYATIEPDGDTLGHVRYTRGPRWNPDIAIGAREWRLVVQTMMTALAGREGARLVDRSRWRDGAQADEHAAVEVASYVDEHPTFFRWVESRTRRLVVVRRSLVAAVAERLLVEPRISGANLRAMVRGPRAHDFEDLAAVSESAREHAERYGYPYLDVWTS